LSQDINYDITEICKMLGTTSRTLRFYEEKGIISSTKSVFSSRRCYTEEQVSHIKQVMVLRTIGLSIDSIKKLQDGNADLKSEILSKRAEIYAQIESKSKEISLLNEALALIEHNDNIFSVSLNPSATTNEFSHIAKKCSYALIFEDYDTLYDHFSKKMIEYLPKDLLKIKRQDALFPCGELIELGETEQSGTYSNIVYQYVKFKKIGLKIKFVFHNGKIDGLWLSYYEN